MECVGMASGVRAHHNIVTLVGSTTTAKYSLIDRAHLDLYYFAVDEIIAIQSG